MSEELERAVKEYGEGNRAPWVERALAKAYAALETTNRLLMKELEQARERVRDLEAQRPPDGYAAHMHKLEAQVQALTREAAPILTLGQAFQISGTGEGIVAEAIRRLEEYKLTCSNHRERINALTNENIKKDAEIAALTLENAELRDQVADLEDVLSGRTVSCGNCSTLEAREREMVKERDEMCKALKQETADAWNDNTSLRREIASLQSEKSLLTKAVEDRDKALDEYSRCWNTCASKTQGHSWEDCDCGLRSTLERFEEAALSPRQPQAEAKP